MKKMREMKDCQEEFLALCGLDFGYQELLEKTCRRWNISREELGAACRKIPKYYRIELRGIRRLLGLYVREWMHYEELREDKHLKIYFNVPGTVTGMIWLQQGMPEGTYLGSPDIISMTVLYGIIGRKSRLDTGNCRHCGVNVMRYLQQEENLIPEPDVRWTNGLLCDEAPKIDYMLSILGRRTKQLLLMKSDKDEDQRDSFRIKVKNNFEEMKNSFGFCSNEKEYRSIKIARFELALRIHQIVRLMNKDKKFYISNADISLIETLLLTVVGKGIQEMTEVVTEIYNEIHMISESKNKCGLRDIHNSFAVYYTPLCNPVYSRIFEENGFGLLFNTAFKNKAVAAKKNTETGETDPYEDIAEECLTMLIGKGVVEEAEGISSAILENGLDGIVLGMFTFDRWMGAQEKILRQLVENNTGVRVFSYDTDFWNQESFEEEKLRTAVETLRGTM
jgi:2-hydroxyglutaryl-CoA dehydratase, D-component.